jgi:hypothetical protein
MKRLGYERYGAHGNEGGSLISPEGGRVDPECRPDISRHSRRPVPGLDSALTRGYVAIQYFWVDLLQTVSCVNLSARC